MPASHIALRGWIGEKIVSYWLQNCKNYKKECVLEQVKVKGHPKTGGGHLDFTILDESGKIEAIYEVKTQNYNLDNLNVGLEFLCKESNFKNKGNSGGTLLDEKGKEVRFIQLRKDKEYSAKPNLEINVVLLKSLSKKLEKQKEFEFKPIFFNEIFSELSEQQKHELKKKLKEKFKEEFKKEWSDINKISKEQSEKNKR